MAIHFHGVDFAPLAGFTASAPDGSIIGVTGLDGSGKSALLKAASGTGRPVNGTVDGPEDRRWIGPGVALNLEPIGLLAIDSALDLQDPLARGKAVAGIEKLRRAGATVLLASHDQALLSRLCDEVWWLDGGKLAAKGDPRDVLPRYNAFVASQWAEWGRSQVEPLNLTARRGDGRAEIVTLETAGEDGQNSLVLRNHAPASIRVKVRYLADVCDPVIGIMIRTRVGMEVYGTNTELEQASPGACRAGDLVGLEFRFVCGLCPGEYTITAASHDPDGTAHDWLDDAVAFSVAADRYTAGVADLRATVSVTRG